MAQRRHLGCRVLVLAALVFPAAGCGQPAGYGEGPGHRAQALALSPRQELSLGEQAYREVLSRSDVEPPDSADVERVRRVGERIARASQIEPLQREINLRVKGYRFDWAFNVIRSRQVNAFCLPGGKVAVFSGLLPLTETDDQLATVLGHEIAHALAHHASERIARQQKYQTAMDALNGAMGTLGAAERRELIGLLGAGAELRSLSYDRQQESEADHIGLFLMAFAGYDPDQALVFWQHMQRRASQGHLPEILSNHPSDAHRIAQIRRWAVSAKAAFRAWKAGDVAPAPGPRVRAYPRTRDTR